MTLPAETVPHVYPIEEHTDLDGLLRQNRSRLAQAGAAYLVVVDDAATLDAPSLDAWARMLPLVRESVSRGHESALQRAALVYQPQAAIGMADIALLEMQKKASESVLLGTGWLSAADIGRSSERSASNPGALANRWKTERKVFALNWKGRDLFPAYAFDERLNPRPAVGEILRLFGAGMDPWRIASWFESPNAWLDGRRPREVLVDPSADASVLVDAARRKAGWTHG
jgi:hypothetical protein